MKIKFISLASGSSGNCYFLGTDRYGILVDAGIGIRTIKKTLKELGIGLDIIRAVFITHAHADHIKAVGHLEFLFTLLRKYMQESTKVIA